MLSSYQKGLETPNRSKVVSQNKQKKIRRMSKKNTFVEEYEGNSKMRSKEFMLLLLLVGVRLHPRALPKNVVYMYI